MRICPECGAEAAEEAKFCVKCGARLPERAEPIAEEPASAAEESAAQGPVLATGAPVQEEASCTCSSCGHVNPAGAPYCEVCGAPLSAWTRPQARPQSEESPAAAASQRSTSSGSHFSTVADESAAEGPFVSAQAASSQSGEQHSQSSDEQFQQPVRQQGQTIYGPPTSWDAEDGGNGKAEHAKAVLSLVLGIIGVVIYWPSHFLLNALSAYSGVCLFAGSITGIVLGIVGLILASKAKRAGNREGVRTAGFVLSIIAIVLNAIYFAACAATVTAVASFYDAMFTGEI